MKIEKEVILCPVKAGQIIGYVSVLPVNAEIDGVLRGIIHLDLITTKNLKIGDIDPRGIREKCFRISSKARAVGDGVYEALKILKDRIDSYRRDRFNRPPSSSFGLTYWRSPRPRLRLID